MISRFIEHWEAPPIRLRKRQVARACEWTDHVWVALTSGALVILILCEFCGRQPLETLDEMVLT